MNRALTVTFQVRDMINMLQPVGTIAKDMLASSTAAVNAMELPFAWVASKERSRRREGSRLEGSGLG